MSVGALCLVLAGYYTITEVPILLEQGISAYVLGLSTCAWGSYLLRCRNGTCMANAHTTNKSLGHPHSTPRGFFPMQETNQQLRPRTTRLYRVVLVVKGFDGIVETVAGILVLTMQHSSVTKTLVQMLRSEFTEFPDTAVTRYVLQLFATLPVKA